MTRSLVVLLGTMTLGSVVTLGVPETPRAKACVVLFSGKPEAVAANWIKAKNGETAAWKVADGSLIAGGGDIITREKYSNFQLHIEFKVPLMPDKKGQSRGNSGVKLQGRYEIQILDSYGNTDPGTGDCGAVYTIAAPLVNACKPPMEWQTFDISFRAPTIDPDGAVKAPGRVTVIQNGIVVQNNTAITKPTGMHPLDKDLGQPGPILLQDHGCNVEFRNIWIRPLPPQGAKHY